MFEDVAYVRTQNFNNNPFTYPSFSTCECFSIPDAHEIIGFHVWLKLSKWPSNKIRGGEKRRHNQEKGLLMPIYSSCSFRFHIWMTSWVLPFVLQRRFFSLRELFISQILIRLSQIMEISHMNGWSEWPQGRAGHGERFTGKAEKSELYSSDTILHHCWWTGHECSSAI